MNVNLVNINEEDWVLNAQITDDRYWGVLVKKPKYQEEREIHKKGYIKNYMIYKISPKGKNGFYQHSKTNTITLS